MDVIQLRCELFAWNDVSGFYSAREIVQESIPQVPSSSLVLSIDNSRSVKSQNTCPFPAFESKE
jgi:hypothetical protein